MSTTLQDTVNPTLYLALGLQLTSLVLSFLGGVIYSCLSRRTLLIATIFHSCTLTNIIEVIRLSFFIGVPAQGVDDVSPYPLWLVGLHYTSTFTLELFNTTCIALFSQMFTTIVNDQSVSETRLWMSLAGAILLAAGSATFNVTTAVTPWDPPFPIGNYLILMLLFLSGAVTQTLILIKAYRTRRRSNGILSQSFISSSIIYRLLFVLFAVVFLSLISIVRPFTVPIEYRFQALTLTRDSDFYFAKNDIWNALVGIVAFLAMASSVEAKGIMRRFYIFLSGVGSSSNSESHESMSSKSWRKWFKGGNSTDKSENSQMTTTTTTHTCDEMEQIKQVSPVLLEAGVL